MRVLVVEDERRMAAALQRGLQAEGFAVDLAHDGEDGLHQARHGEYDVVVLDIMLPRISGYNVCKQLRAEENWVPILMLSAKDGEYDMADGLDLGADDYLTKPFSYVVLVARLRALLRRDAGRRPAVLLAGDLSLDPARRRVSRGDADVELTPREFALLEFLMRHHDEVVSKREILEHVWDTFDTDPNVVEVYVGYLRRKIDVPFGKNALQTVRARVTGWPAMVAEPAAVTGSARRASPMGWWRRQSLRFRVTAAASAVLALALAASAWVLVGVLSQSLIATIDESAYQRAHRVRADADADRLPPELSNPDGTLIQVIDATGRITHATVGTDRLVPLLGPQARQSAIRAREARFLDGRPYGIPGPLRVAAVAADRGQVVIAARSFDEVGKSVAAAGRVLFLGTPILIVLLAGASWMIVGRTLRPIASLRRGAAEITGTARSRRLPVPEARDEVHSLATTLNDMLARLEAADGRQRALVSDAAHELRSPLASIRLQLEVALDHPEGQEWRDTAEGVLEDAMRLSRLAEDLLALARLDERGGALARREPVDLDALVRQGTERYADNPVLVRRAVPDEQITVTGDALDLGRVLTNLIDNAVRHATSAVVVELRVSGSEALLSVTDDGPGIPEADRERVFDRFTRLDSARSRDEGGAGLGLAIVRETVRAHGGGVHLADACPGLRAVVALPLRQDSSIK